MVLMLVSAFRKLYNRGDFPIGVNYDARGKKIKWKVIQIQLKPTLDCSQLVQADIEKLDYHYYLPLFFAGLVETEEPYSFLAPQAIHDMLVKGGDKVLPVIPQLILPIKRK